MTRRKKPRSTRRSFGRLRQFRSGRWKASYTGPDGRLYSAPHTFAAKIDAEAWLTDRRREIDRELWSPPGTAKPKAKPITFREYSERWLEHRTVHGRPLKKRTREHYRDLLDDHLLPTFGALPLASITADDVHDWYAVTLTDKPTMRSHAYGLLRTILGTAASDAKIDGNPCQIRGAGSARRKIAIRPATLDELATLTAAMPERFQPMILLASWGALRFGELTELRRKDIQLGSETVDGETVRFGVIHISRGAVRTEDGIEVDTPKSEAGSRDVEVPPHLVPVLERHLRDHVKPQRDALLFPAQHGGHLAPATLYRHFYPARKAAGREDLRFHDLRHTGATLAAVTGATLAELMNRLGHSTPQAALRYQHVASGRDRAIAALLSKMAGGA
ncbi:tyrosine-type recombinase/integrase [Nocardia asiatica]|uniref:tyrosine-type recombinase/integrase n=1 Tax=Nocardia asiatica TaxID=209252 RepID=UPI0024566031|nr:site-specific integrase [Nocardia asiatica]